MFKITKKQQDEIDFFSKKWDSFIPTEEERGEYIKWTVNGEKKDWRMTCNRLFIAKRKLDIIIKFWKQDIYQWGLLRKKELLEDEELRCPYFSKIVNSI
jgi:hypothetical protein